MRTALVGRPMVRFDAPVLVGPVPQAGRTIEQVETHGKHLEVAWDDGLVLDTHLKGTSEWHVYRPGDPWRRGYDQLRASIETDDWVAVCFSAPTVETYRKRERDRHPGRGPLGPDLTSASSDLTLATELLLGRAEPKTRLRDALVDEHVMQGVGNVYRCEVLWALELSPWAYVADLGVDEARLIVETAAEHVRAAQRRSSRSSGHAPLAVYGRCGQACPRCHETIESRPVGREGRMMYWCPGCQVHLDHRDATPITDGLQMDRHPAAAVFLHDMPWRANPDEDA
jgi:endonuclease-8